MSPQAAAAAAKRAPGVSLFVLLHRHGLFALLVLVILLLLAARSDPAATALRLHAAPSLLHASLAPGVAAMCAGRAPRAPAAPLLAPPASAASTAARGGGSPDAVFSQIYSTKRWSADGGGSGSGSTLSSTATLRAFIEMLVYRHQVTRVLDAPCGSSFWWPELLQRLRAAVPCLAYHGVDVVRSVVDASRAAYAGDALTTFQVADLAAPGVGAGLRAAAAAAPFDLALCRDALQHLPLALAVGVLENLAASGARLVALGSYLEETAGNAEIPVGEYYKINLLLPPFSLNASRAVDVLNEASSRRNERKYMLLFPGEYLAGLDYGAMRERARQFAAARRARAEEGAALAPRSGRAKA